MNRLAPIMDFDQKAEQWDKDPVKIQRAKVFAERIVGQIHPRPSRKALEFGCGTGQVSFFLKDHFGKITLVDNSAGMIEVLKKKIRSGGIDNMEPFFLDIFHDPLPVKDLDVIFTLMTLHHIPEIEKALEILHAAIAPDGYLCIGDLLKEDGSFHDFTPEFKGHHGFSREYLKTLLAKKGFREIYYELFFEIEKREGDQIKKYPLFFLLAEKEPVQK